MKFRGKRKYGSEVITGYYNVIDAKHYIFNGDNLNSPDWFEIYPTTLAMSTGVTDKNGIEIFGSVPVDGVMSKGGDLIQRTIKIGTFEVANYNEKVVWCDCGFDTVDLDSGESMYMKEFLEHTVLITGKQYEHGSE